MLQATVKYSGFSISYIYYVPLKKYLNDSVVGCYVYTYSSVKAPTANTSTDCFMDPVVKLNATLS